MKTKSSNKGNKGSKTDTAGKDVRSRIITGAAHHFFTHGFRSVTMDDLASELGMSKKTLYVHFPSKAALVEAVLWYKNEQIGEAMVRITSRDFSDVAATVHELVTSVQRHMADMKPPFLRDMRRAQSETFAAVEALRQRIIRKHFSKILAKGRKAGFIRDDLPIDVIIEVFIAASQVMLSPKKLEELNLSPQQSFGKLHEILFNGIMQKKNT